MERAFEIDLKDGSRTIALLPGFDALPHDSRILPHRVRYPDSNGSVVVTSMSTFLKGQDIHNNFFGTSNKDEMMPSLDEIVLRHGLDVLKQIEPLRVEYVRVSNTRVICRNGTTISTSTQCKALETLLDDLDAELTRDVALSTDLEMKRLEHLDAEREILQSAYTLACDRVVHVELKSDDAMPTTFLSSQNILDFVTRHMFLLSQETLGVVAYLLDDNERLPLDVMKSLKYEIRSERRRRCRIKHAWNFNQPCKTELNVRMDTFPKYKVFPNLKSVPYNMPLKDISDVSHLRVSPSTRWVWIRREIPRNLPIPLPLCDTSEQRASIMFCDDDDDDTSLSIPMLYEREGESLMLWMSLSPMELMSLNPLILQAHGRVVVCGLGIGYMLTQIMLRDDVTEVVLIEQSQELIDWILPRLQKSDCPLRIVTGDVFEELPHIRDRFGVKFDIAVVDTFAVFDSKVENRAAIKRLRSTSESAVSEVIGWAT